MYVPIQQQVGQNENGEVYETIEQRLARQDQQLKYLINGAGQNAQMEHKIAMEKEISIRQIVEEEKKLVEDRLKKQMAELKANNDLKNAAIVQEDQVIRQKNETLQKQIVDKENDVVQQGKVIADLESQLRIEREANDVKAVKIKALTEMVDKQQRKLDGLLHSEQEKTVAL